MKEEENMAHFIKVATTQEIPAGQGKTVEVEGKQIALFNIEGSFHAIDNTCLHRGGPLGEGMLEGSTVTCPWHGWQYDVKTGQNCMNPEMKVGCYQVKTEGEDILVAPQVTA